MKARSIILAVFIICISIGCLLEMMATRQALTPEQMCINHCLQSLTWLPIGSTVGIYMITSPNTIVNWVNHTIPVEIRRIIQSLNTSPLIIRLYGILLLTLTLIGMWYSCKDAIYLIGY